MAFTSGVADTVSLPNYAGQLLLQGDISTPIFTLSAAGAMTVASDTFVMGNVYSYDSASAGDLVSETGSLTAPTASHLDSTQLTNYIELHQRRLTFSYKKQSQTSVLSGAAVIDQGVVQNTFQEQVDKHLTQMRLNMEYSMLLGAGTAPSNAGTTGATRGILTALAADGNTQEDAAGAAVSTTIVENLERKIVTYNSPTDQWVIVCGAIAKQKLDALYGIQPESATVGGFQLQTIILPILGPVPIVYSPVVNAAASDDIIFANLSAVRPVFMPVPGKGTVFAEPLAKTGASEDWQLYAQFGVDYGRPTAHGVISNIDVS